MALDITRISEQFLSSLDAEIDRLQALRQQVTEALGVQQPIVKAKAAKRKGMSAEGRKRIAEAQRARWAKQKGAAKKARVTKTTAKKSPAKSQTKKNMAKKAAKTAAKDAAAS